MTESSNTRAVFLDRDGVLNRSITRDGKPYPPGCVEEFELLPGVEEALNELKQRGYLLICVTNQPDVARGKQTRQNVEVMHGILRSRLPVDAIEVCYDDDDNSPLRKPNPGMLLEAAGRYNIDLGNSFMIGDRWRDVEAGRRVGCRTIFVDHGYDEALAGKPDVTVSNLREAADWIIAQDNEGDRT